MKLGIPKRRIRTNTAGTALAGLQAGVLAGLAALIYLMIDGAIRGRGLWSFANLISSTMYDVRVVGNSLRWATVTGMALHLFISGLVGVVCAFLLVRFVSKPVRGFLLAAVLGLLWYFVSCRYFWPRMNPAVVLYQPFPGMLQAHVVFGLFMGLSPRFAREIGPLGKQPEHEPFL